MLPCSRQLPHANSQLASLKSSRSRLAPSRSCTHVQRCLRPAVGWALAGPQQQRRLHPHTRLHRTYPCHYRTHSSNQHASVQTSALPDHSSSAAVLDPTDPTADTAPAQRLPADPPILVINDDAPASPLAATAAAVPDPDDFEQPSEAGILPEDVLDGLSGTNATTAFTPSKYAFAYAPKQRSHIRGSWDTLMRWSKVFRTSKTANPLEDTYKVVVFGGGSFGTAMATSLARQKPTLDVVLLLRDPYLCHDINTLHINTKYLKDHTLPLNVRATTSAAEAVPGAQYAVHAVPVQHSRALLSSVRDLLSPTVPIICVSKGLEVATGSMMSELIPSALERKQPAVFLSGPSFAKEVMENRPTGVVAACRDPHLARTVQALFASQTMRVNMTTDVVGVEICGALKNVLAIAAGIVEGLGLGNNSLAALISQGCAEIRWLSQAMGAKPTTMAGLSGLGDIMLTCYGSLSRNRTVGIRLGQGERLQDILASSNQVAEGVATAGVVVSLARKYRVSLPVLTAVAQVLDSNLTPSEAVHHIMNLPQVEEH